MRRLSLIDQAVPRTPSQPPGPAVTRERVATSWVALVPVDERATLEFASTLLGALAARGRTATVLLDAPRFEGALLEEGARPPDGLVTHGGDVLRVLASEDHTREAWLRALTAGPGPFVAIGTEALGQIEPRLAVAVTHGQPMGLSAPRYRQVRGLVDVELVEPRPAFAEWLADALS